MLLSEGLNSPEYYRYDNLLSFHAGPQALEERTSSQTEGANAQEPQHQHQHQHQHQQK